jgi:hypothetical protein
MRLAGDTVTESKTLYDVYSGQAREVDVVAEGELDGEDLVVSPEVVDRKRVISLTWVDEMLGKHWSLPTNQWSCSRGRASLARPGPRSTPLHA